MKLLVLALGIAVALSAADDFKRTEDVIYGRKFGTALTMDVIEPAKPNGFGMVFVVSGTWKSNHASIVPKYFNKVLERGYTVFAVVPSSQPRFTIPEIIEDVRLAVKVIQTDAARWKVDGTKIGLSGFSAGCHLALLAMEKAGSVACFFPPTDFLNWGQTGVNGAGVGPLAAYREIFGPKAGTEELGRAVSPVYLVNEKTPPVLLIHGDKDRTVPLQQSEIFIEKMKQAGAKHKLIVMPGKDHGWATIYDDFTLLADWFDQTLRGIQAVP
jgi:acetyl esterase/lipase